MRNTMPQATAAETKCSACGRAHFLTPAEIDRMPRTPGICAYCGQDTMVYALAEFSCRKCLAADMEVHGESGIAKRPEES